MSSNGQLIPRGADKNADTDSLTTPPDGRPASAQPRWRQDFPIDWSRDEYVSRRELVKFVVLTSTAFAVGQLWVAIQRLLPTQGESLKATLVARLDELAIGDSKIFHYPAGSTPRILVRTGETSFVAYDQACTHLMCPVVPAVETGKLHCPCHNGWFDLATGSVLAGPPQRPLPRVFVEVRGDGIWATGVEGTVS